MRLAITYSSTLSAIKRKMLMSQPNLNPSVGPSPDAFGTLKKYVRVRSKPEDRFVEFDFAIGDPNLFVELVMPPGAFAAFCRNHRVVPMTADQVAEVDAQMAKWRYGEDTLVARNKAP